MARPVLSHTVTTTDGNDPLFVVSEYKKKNLAAKDRLVQEKSLL